MEALYDIYFQFKNSKISQNEAFNYFCDILENTNDDRLILEILQIFKKNEIKNEDSRFLHVLENLFVVNGDHHIKAQAIQLYISLKPKAAFKITVSYLKSLLMTLQNKNDKLSFFMHFSSIIKEIELLVSCLKGNSTINIFRVISENIMEVQLPKSLLQVNRALIFNKYMKLPQSVVDFYDMYKSGSKYTKIRVKFNFFLKKIILDNTVLFIFLESIWNHESNVKFLRNLWLEHFRYLITKQSYENPETILERIVLPLDKSTCYVVIYNKIYQSMFKDYSDSIILDLSLGPKVSKLSDVKFYCDFTNIKYISLSYWGLEDIENISQFPNLKRVNLSFNFIKDLSPLLKCENLMRVNISGNSVSGLDKILEVLLHVEKNRQKSSNKATVQSSLMNQKIINLVKKGIRKPEEIARKLNISKKAVYSRLGHMSLNDCLKYEGI